MVYLKRERLIIIGAKNDLNHQLNFPPHDVDISLKNIVKFDMEEQFNMIIQNWVYLKNVLLRIWIMRKNLETLLSF